MAFQTLMTVYISSEEISHRGLEWHEGHDDRMFIYFAELSLKLTLF